MKEVTFDKLKTLGFTGAIDTPSTEVMAWLNQSELLRIEPFWRYLGGEVGFSWSKSWDCFSPKIYVQVDTWEELLDLALERSVEEAL